MTLKRNTKVLLKNYYLLDLLRGAAALSVVFYHHQHFYRLTAGYDSKFSKESQPYYSILSYFYNNGSIAVELFWTISGFVLALNYFQNSKSRKSFFRNRFARLYPLHFFTLALVVLLQTWSKAFIGHFQIYPTNDVYHFFLNVFGIPFVGLEKDYSFNGPIWSVSVEIISYLIFGFILRFLRNSRILPFLILVLSIILFRIQPFNIGHSIYESFVFFFFGVALYRCYEYLSLVLRIFFGAGLVISFLALKIIGKYSIFGLNHDGAISTNRLNFLLIFGGIIVLLCVIQELRTKEVEGVKSISQWIGNLTYSSYLIHVPLQILILILIQTFKLNQLNIVTSGTFLLLYLFGLILLSRVSYIYLEKPLRIKLRQKDS